ncbi:unnamed protein product [Parnassius apollo]|uniref:(apollo) hypothetical protein n=1 Tax=Parnassius apollo TaxID=110799 RepID=A0A8S3Y1F0_PARAO|nr:unnamed protein product [Parnassius apollo]
MTVKLPQTENYFKILISNVTSAQTSDTVAAQTADNVATFSRDDVDDSLPEYSHWSPRLVNPESAPYQNKDNSETSEAEQNQSDQETHSLKPTENPVCQEPETSQPANVPTCDKSDSSFVMTSPNNSFHFYLLKHPLVLPKSVEKRQLSRRLPTNKN